ncbi:MAG: prepilin-type N-terminal cleavage/methylation domain-containing protein [Sedimentisphaeraceae bacterium JB056]
MSNNIKNTEAFTLIELLIVISVIALLISIIIPALGRAKATAKKLQCADNIRQIRIAMDLYSHDYDNCIITAREMLFAHSIEEVKGLWHVILTPYIDHSEIRDMLADKYPKLWRCPEDQDPYPMGFRGYPHKIGMTSYALNGYYSNTDNTEIQFGPAANLKFSQIPSPSKCMLMAETSYCGQIYDAKHPNTLDPNIRLDGHHRMTSGFYHNSAMNLLFVDGHIESFKGIDCEIDESMIPWPYKNGGFMFWPDKRLKTATEDPIFWGPGY